MKINKKILIFGTYPIVNPLHGGQRRVDAIVREYSAKYKEVKYVAVFIKDHYPDYSSSDIYLKGQWASEARSDHLTSDIRIGKAIYESPRIRKRITKLINNFNPDVIQIEQVFPYIGLKRILENIHSRAKIIHSSHNIEAKIKKEVMSIAMAEKKYIDQSISLIDDYETDLAKNADLVIAVSDSDGEYLIKKGCRSYILAPNGAHLSKPTKRAIKYWNNIYSINNISNSFGYIGSAHLPNMLGLKNMIGYRLGFINPQNKLILAGSMGNNIENNFDYSNLLDSTFWLRTYNAGTLSEEQLTGLLSKIDVILLPMCKGGGSNLKTAEAILSQKKIVATDFAFRGFEKYKKLPNIYIGNKRNEFIKKMNEAIISPKKDLNRYDRDLLDSVRWESSLKKMVQEVGKI